MKHRLLAGSIGLLLSAASLTVVASTDGVIEFSGLVTDVTCSVEGQNPGLGTVKKEVELGSIVASRLGAAGQRANPTGFTIRVGAPGEASCTNGRKAMVAFDPASPAIDAASGRLNIDGGDGTAGNVQIEVTQRDGTPINVYTDKSAPVEIVNNQAQLLLAAQYYATGAASQGKVASRVGFLVEYAE